MFGYDAGIDRTDPSYFIGAAIPLVIATGGSAVLPAGRFSYLLPWVSTAQASCTTVWGTTATVGVTAEGAAAMAAIAQQARAAREAQKLAVRVRWWRDNIQYARQAGYGQMAARSAYEFERLEFYLARMLQSLRL